MTRLVHAISDLLADIPQPGASDSDRVAYFDRKANVLDRIATEADSPADAARATELAANARVQVARLRGEIS